MLNDIRVGKFTSSEIYLLMKNGRGSAPSVATTSYIEEKRMERRLQRSLNADVSGRPTIWGNLLELRLSTLLSPFEYDYRSAESIVHPTIPTWAGTPDFTAMDRVADAKCPYTLKAFCQLADIAIAQDLEKFKSTKPEYYWQLVSNAVLTGKPKAELIPYCPYKDELAAIREMCEVSNEDQNKLAWIFFSSDEDLPYLIPGGYYKNMYSFIFDVPQDDIAALTEAVQQASIVLEAA